MVIVSEGLPGVLVCTEVAGKARERHEGRRGKVRTQLPPPMDPRVLDQYQTGW